MAHTYLQPGDVVELPPGFKMNNKVPTALVLAADSEENPMYEVLTLLFGDGTMVTLTSTPFPTTKDHYAYCVFTLLHRSSSC